MRLGKNEYTTKEFVELLEELFKKKINGKRFTSNDVAQYLIRGYTPYRYGGFKISAENHDGMRVIKIKKNKKNKCQESTL